MGKEIKAVLIDSGKVLNSPVTGHWFITPNFFSYVDEKNYKSISKGQRRMAFGKAGDYISRQSLISTEEEEYKHFFEYYRLFFTELSSLNITEDRIGDVAKDLVYNYEKYKFYRDALEVIPELNKRYKLAVVSDAWPSLENVFRSAGMREYFSSFVISSVKGIAKPHESMYRTALEELNVSSEEAVFIDDNIRNCDGAKRLGIKSFLLCRDLRLFAYHKLKCRDHIVIQNLSKLMRLI